MGGNLFLNGFIYLVAAALAAPIGRRLGVGAVLGYLIIGVIIGPSAFSLVGENREVGGRPSIRERCQASYLQN